VLVDVRRALENRLKVEYERTDTLTVIFEGGIVANSEETKAVIVDSDAAGNLLSWRFSTRPGGWRSRTASRSRRSA